MKRTKNLRDSISTRFPEDLWRGIHRAAEVLTTLRGSPVKKADVIREATVRYVRLVLGDGA